MPLGISKVQKLVLSRESYLRSTIFDGDLAVAIGIFLTEQPAVHRFNIVYLENPLALFINAASSRLHGQFNERMRA